LDYDAHVSQCRLVPSCVPGGLGRGEAEIVGALIESIEHAFEAAVGGEGPDLRLARLRRRVGPDARRKGDGASGGGWHPDADPAGPLHEGPAELPAGLSAAETVAYLELTPVDGAWLDSFAGLDPAALDGSGRVRLARLAQRVECYAAAVRLSAVAAYAGPETRRRRAGWDRCP
jgi:hypothetical protein